MCDNIDQKLLDWYAKRLVWWAKRHNINYISAEDVKQEIRLLVYSFPETPIALLMARYRKDFKRKFYRRWKKENEVSLANNKRADPNFELVDLMYDEELKYKRGSN